MGRRSSQIDSARAGDLRVYLRASADASALRCVSVHLPVPALWRPAKKCVILEIGACQGGSPLLPLLI